MHPSAPQLMQKTIERQLDFLTLQTSKGSNATSKSHITTRHMKSHEILTFVSETDAKHFRSPTILLIALIIIMRSL